MLKRKIFSFISGEAKNPEKNATHSEDLEKGKFHFNKGSIHKNCYKYLIVNTENKKNNSRHTNMVSFVIICYYIRNMYLH